jgi:tetratricopeptide (TPR) repeat protein
VRARRRTRGRAAALGISAAVVAIAAAAGGFLALRADAPGAGPVTVAVADFANQTGEPELDGLSGMLITSLEQSQRLSVLTRVRMLDVLRQMGKANVAAVDEALGRELALSAGVRALVLATIRRFDELYAIELKVLDPVRSEYLFTLKEEGRGKSSVPGMIDRLSDRTRERLRETPAEVQASSARIADLTTASLDAYQHYFRGEQLKEAIRYEPAVEAYRKAIEVDPGFALAHYRIAYLGKFLGLDDRERGAHMDGALRNADRVPGKERLLIQAWKAVMDGRGEEAHRLYARAVEAHPQDKEVLFMAGDQYVHEDEWAKALPYFERSVALDATFEPSLMHLSDCLAALGRTDELTLVASRWTARAPSAAGFRALTVAHVAGGRSEEAVSAARRALELDGAGYSRNALGEALVLSGRYAEAETLLRPYGVPGASRLDRALAVPTLAAAIAYQGRRREALRVLDAYPEEMEGKRGARRAMKLEILLGDGPAEANLREARALAADGDPRVTKGIPLTLALLGDLGAAAEAATKLPPEMRRLYEAAVAWRSGDRARATSLARELSRGQRWEDRAPALWMLASVAAEVGADEEVIASAEALRRSPGGAWRSWALPEAIVLAAKAHERRGERGKARTALDGLLATWKGADADLPHLAEARELRARLGR